MTMDHLLLQHDVAAYLAHEADLLDRREFKAWLDLFEDDGLYWVPSSRNQTDMKGHVSVMLEDKALLALRTERLGHPHAYSVEPHPDTVHLVGNITVQTENDIIIARSKLMVDEMREDRQSRWSGSVTHQLRRRDNGFGIVLKRVDLTHAGNTFTAITIPL